MSPPRINLAPSGPPCFTAPSADKPRRPASGCCSSFPQATCTNTSVWSAAPPPAPKRTGNNRTASSSSPDRTFHSPPNAGSLRRSRRGAVVRQAHEKRGGSNDGSKTRQRTRWGCERKDRTGRTKSDEAFQRNALLNKHDRDVFPDRIEDLFVGSNQPAIELFPHRLARLVF